MKIEDKNNLPKMIPLGKAKDWSKEKVGKLQPLYRIEGSKNDVTWLVKCNCNNYISINAKALAKGLTTSCGCDFLETIGNKISNSRTPDLTGQVFGRLTVIEKAQIKPVKWRCVCTCGNETLVPTTRLKSGETKSCGCLKHELLGEDFTGKTFGRLTVLKRAENKNGRVYWTCQCSCENKTILDVRSDQLIAKVNGTRSCGCLVKDHAKEIGHNNYGRNIVDWTGETKGKLTVKMRAPREIEDKRPLWICQCSCGMECIKNSDYLRESPNPNCGCETMSYGEQKVRDILYKNDIQYITQHTFDDCRYENNYPAWFDFYLPDYNTIIEYDGEQHFGYKDNGGWNTKEHFEKVQKYDAIKNQYCFDNNINLIRIPYAHFNFLTLEDLLPASSQFLLKATK